MINTDKATILIIDDTPANISLMSGLLQDQYKIKAATTGKKGLEIAMLKPQPDLILLDIMMPEMDGYEVCKVLKTNPQTVEIPVIFLTAKAESQDEEKGLKMGAVDYITKPVSPPIALTRIATHIDLYQQKRALVESQQALSEEIQEAALYIQSLLPKPLANEGIQSSWQHIPSSSLGGDAFGYHWIDDDHMAIFLIDVCGHGVGAAMLCISAINSIRSESLTKTDFTSPASVLNGLNRAFPMEQQNLKYFTIWYGVYSPSNQTLSYASAGHPHAILLNSNNAQDKEDLIKLATKGVAIGCFEDVKYTESKVELKKHNKLYVFSDGVYEITNKKNEEMTLEEFTKLIQESFNATRKLQSKEIYSKIKELKNDKGPFVDDFSIIELIFSH